MAFKNGDRVTVRIGRIDSPTVAYVPGIVTNAVVSDRELITTKLGRFTVQNSIEVVTLRASQPGSGREGVYYTNRPENLIAVTPRETMVPAIDGDGTMTYAVLKPLLQALVAASTAALNPAPEKSIFEQAMEPFLTLPALTPVKA